jgi:hypothetical protein
VDFGHGSRVVEALARQSEKYVDRTLDLLARKVEDFETDPMTWLEIFLVLLAGEMRLERAIPLVVRKLHECGEVLSEACVEALGKIGTDAATEAVAEGWLDAVWDYRLYAPAPWRRFIRTRRSGSAWICWPGQITDSRGTPSWPRWKVLDTRAGAVSTPAEGVAIHRPASSPSASTSSPDQSQSPWKLRGRVLPATSSRSHRRDPAAPRPAADCQHTANKRAGWSPPGAASHVVHNAHCNTFPKAGMSCEGQRSY